MVTIGSGAKVFCSGFNIKFWAKSPDNVSQSLLQFHNLLRRILTMGLPTVGVANGHTIAGGVFLCLVHDHTIMNGNPKFKMHMNEIDNGFVTPLGLVRIIQEHTTPLAYKRLVLGERMTSTTVKAIDIINSLYTD